MLDQTLEITVIELSQNKTIGSVNIPIWTIATGPSSFDYIMNKGDSYNGRLSFEVKMSQYVYFEIKCKTLHCKFKDRLDEKYYRYNFYLFVSIH